MSSDRNGPHEKGNGYSFATCQKLKEYNKKGGYVGTQRAPKYPDELGALAVVVGMEGARTVLYPIVNDKERVRVVGLKPWVNK